MSGDVSPYEWIVPPLAIAHESFALAAPLVGQAADLVSGRRHDTLVTPPPSLLAQERTKTPRAQSAPAEARSRRRASAAAERLGIMGARRASETLTDSGEQTLGFSP